MNQKTMDVAQYFLRIGYNGKAVPDLETLFALHERHVKSIPFENLNIMSGRKIILDDETLFRKIIEERRGGVCYELNALFFGLLLHIGFKVSVLSSITKYGGNYGVDFDHMSLLVESDGNHWLADVGLREPMLRPVNLFCSDWQLDRPKSIKLIAYQKGFYHLWRTSHGSFAEEYKFSLQPHAIREFENMSRFHESNPMSPLNRYLHCSIATEEGTMNIKGNRLIRIKNGSITFFTITDDSRSYRRLVRFAAPFSFSGETTDQIFFMMNKSGVIAA